MAKQDYTLNVVNGIATTTLPVGTYTYVSNTIKGYQDGTVSEFTITPTTTKVSATITATGVLEITVEDDLGTKITSGSVQLAAQDKSQLFGTAAEITEGKATFNNVPYDTDGVAVYVSQSASDESHDPITDTLAVSMTQNPQTAQLENARKSFEVEVDLSDAVYAGITALNGGLVVNG